MSLLYTEAVVPEEKDDIQDFLDEISNSLNSGVSGSVATGGVNFYIREPEAEEDKWEVEVSGQISDGQDNNGNEVWIQTKLEDFYLGETLKGAVGQLFSDFKLHYGGNLL